MTWDGLLPELLEKILKQGLQRGLALDGCSVWGGTLCRKRLKLRDIIACCCVCKPWKFIIYSARLIWESVAISMFFCPIHTNTAKEARAVIRVKLGQRKIILRVDEDDLTLASEAVPSLKYRGQLVPCDILNSIEGNSGNFWESRPRKPRAEEWKQFLNEEIEVHTSLARFHIRPEYIREDLGGKKTHLLRRGLKTPRGHFSALCILLLLVEDTSNGCVEKVFLQYVRNNFD